MSNSIKKQTMRGGFTLAEMIVAFGIFAILITIAAGSFVRSVRIQRVALQLMAVNDNIALTMEQMMRELRTGYNFCTKDANLSTVDATVQAQCAALGDDEMQFITVGNVVTRYRLKDNGIQKGIGVASWDPSNPVDVACSEGEFDAVDGICYRTITADTIKVTAANFQALHNDEELITKYPPRLVLSFAITSSDPLVEALTAPITIQTSVSARCGAMACPADF